MIRNDHARSARHRLLAIFGSAPISERKVHQLPVFLKRMTYSLVDLCWGSSPVQQEEGDDKGRRKKGCQHLPKPEASGAESPRRTQKRFGITLFEASFKRLGETRGIGKAQCGIGRQRLAEAFSEPRRQIGAVAGQRLFFPLAERETATGKHPVNCHSKREHLRPRVGGRPPKKVPRPIACGAAEPVFGLVV